MPSILTRPIGGGAGGSVDVTAYSDAGYTTPITSASRGDTIYLRAENVSGFTPVTYAFIFVALSGNGILIYEGANDNTSWSVSGGVGNGKIYVLATDDASEPKRWAGQSKTFEVLGDADASAWLTEVGITDDATVYNATYGVTGANLWNYFNEFYAELKAETGLYEAGHWMYLYIGNSANIAKINLLDPRDLDAAFRVTWNGGWTFNDEGRISNGTNTYGNTHFNANTELAANDGAYFIYKRSQPSGTSNSTEWGAADLATKFNQFTAKSTLDRSFYSIGKSVQVDGLATSILDGFHCITRDNNANVQKWFGDDGSVINTDTSSWVGNPNFNEYLGARNNSGSPVFYLENGAKVAMEGRFDGLSDNQVEALRTAVRNLMSNIGWTV